MALTINEETTTNEGSTLSSFYIRLEVVLHLSGTRVDVEYTPFLSKAAYQAGATPISRSAKLKLTDYNYTVNPDVQDYAHACLKAFLSTSQGYTYDEYDVATPIPAVHSAENITITDLE